MSTTDRIHPHTHMVWARAIKEVATIQHGRVRPLWLRCMSVPSISQCHIWINWTEILFRIPFANLFLILYSTFSTFSLSSPTPPLCCVIVNRIIILLLWWWWWWFLLSTVRGGTGWNTNWVLTRGIEIIGKNWHSFTWESDLSQRIYLSQLWLCDDTFYFMQEWTVK